jgi:hypothetical protein
LRGIARGKYYFYKNNSNKKDGYPGIRLNFFDTLCCYFENTRSALFIEYIQAPAKMLLYRHLLRLELANMIFQDVHYINNETAAANLEMAQIKSIADAPNEVM